MQPVLFFIPKTESNVLMIIAATKFGRKVVGGGNDIVNIAKITVAQGTQVVRERSRIFNFRTHQPQGVDERNAPKFLPLLSKVPEFVISVVLLSKSNRLIAN